MRFACIGLVWSKLDPERCLEWGGNRMLSTLLGTHHPRRPPTFTLSTLRSLCCTSTSVLVSMRIPSFRSSSSTARPTDPTNSSSESLGCLPALNVDLANVPPHPPSAPSFYSTPLIHTASHNSPHPQSSPYAPKTAPSTRATTPPPKWVRVHTGSLLRLMLALLTANSYLAFVSPFADLSTTPNSQIRQLCRRLR